MFGRPVVDWRFSRGMQRRWPIVFVYLLIAGAQIQDSLVVAEVANDQPDQQELGKLPH